MLNKCLILFPPVDTSETPLTSHETVPCLPSPCKQCAVIRANGRSFNLAGIFVLILYATRSLVLLVGSTRALSPPPPSEIGEVRVHQLCWMGPWPDGWEVRWE